MAWTKYGLIFLVCVIAGSILVLVPGGGFFASKELIHFGMEGLLVEQQMAKETMEFNQEVYLRELEEKYREAEHQRQMQILRLHSPAAPDEGY